MRQGRVEHLDFTQPIRISPLSVLHYAIILVSLPVPEATAEVYSRPAAKLYLADYKD